jgi:hypothetical protein
MVRESFVGKNEVKLSDLKLGGLLGKMIEFIGNTK